MAADECGGRGTEVIVVIRDRFSPAHCAPPPNSPPPVAIPPSSSSTTSRPEVAIERIASPPLSTVILFLGGPMTTATVGAGGLGSGVNFVFPPPPPQSTPAIFSDADDPVVAVIHAGIGRSPRMCGGGNEDGGGGPPPTPQTTTAPGDGAVESTMASAPRTEGGMNVFPVVVVILDAIIARG